MDDGQHPHNALLSTTNAAAWADEFCRRFKVGRRGGPEEGDGANWDWGLMAGWFASAIETGRDAGRSEAFDQDSWDR